MKKKILITCANGVTTYKLFSKLKKNFIIYGTDINNIGVGKTQCDYFYKSPPPKNKKFIDFLNTILNQVDLAFLYSDEENCHFMDNKTFEQILIVKSLVGEKYKLLTENLEVSISFMDEKPLSVDLPNNIECIVDVTDAAIKGQTAASSYKPATLDNGLKINVPPFVESGDKIILDTRSLEYLKKVN